MASSTPAGPGLYTKTGKKSRDLLYKGYHTDQKFTFTEVGADGAENNVLVKDICTLESMINEEKMKNKKLYDDKIKLEIDLGYRDQVLEEFECNIGEGKKQIQELKDQLELCKKENEEVKVFAIASCSVAITLGAVLFCIFSNMH